MTEMSKLEVWKKNSAARLELNHTWVAWVDFQMIGSSSNFDWPQLCSPLTYRDPQYLYGKIQTILTYIVSIQRAKKCFQDRVYLFSASLYAVWVKQKHYYACTPVFPYFIYYSWSKKITILIGLIRLEVVVKKSFTTPMSTAINIDDHKWCINHCSSSYGLLQE